MKRSFLLCCLLFVLGCSSVQIPTYLQDKRPYKEKFYANHNQMVASVKQTLQDLGWEIDRSTDPSVYEQQRSKAPDEELLLIITKIRNTPMLVGSRYARMNIYISSKKDVSEVEVRYLTTTSTTLKNFKTYSNDSAVERFFEYVQNLVDKNRK